MPRELSEVWPTYSSVSLSRLTVQQKDTNQAGENGSRDVFFAVYDVRMPS